MNAPLFSIFFRRSISVLFTLRYKIVTRGLRLSSIKCKPQIITPCQGHTSNGTAPVTRHHKPVTRFCIFCVQLENVYSTRLRHNSPLFIKFFVSQDTFGVLISKNLYSIDS